MGDGNEVDLTPGRPRSVARVGRTVRRETGPWTPAVHALLHHLQEVGFDGAPRVLGFDDQGREVLTYVDGEDAHHARRAALHADAALAEVAKLVHRCHEAVADFVPPADAQWQILEDAPREGIVCHNDLSPVNTIYREDRPFAFIDWDYAAPASATWDLACAAWSFVPLADDAFCHRYGYPFEPRGPRLRVFCDAYGLDGHDRNGFLDVVREREMAMYETVRRGAERGHPTYSQVWQQTEGKRWLEAVAYLDEHHEEWQAQLS
jgi:hypothetical protein